MFQKFLTALGFVVMLGLSAQGWAASIFLTGHDPDFHATSLGENFTGARHINQTAINYILDPVFNSFANSGIDKFLFVESDPLSLPSGHKRGVEGITASGFTAGIDFEHHDASTLSGELDLLGTKYGGIVVASDFGGLLTSSELDILNNRSADIISFLNSGGGVYAIAESNGGAGLTGSSTRFGFLPFVVASTPANQTESGITLTAFGLGLGLLATDVNGNFSHNVFEGEFGLNVVDRDALGRILSLAGRGTVTDIGVSAVPVPAALPLFLSGLLGLGIMTRRRKRATA